MQESENPGGDGLVFLKQCVLCVQIPHRGIVTMIKLNAVRKVCLLNIIVNNILVSLEQLHAEL